MTCEYDPRSFLGEPCEEVYILYFHAQSVGANMEILLIWIPHVDQII